MGPEVSRGLCGGQSHNPRLYVRAHKQRRSLPCLEGTVKHLEGRVDVPARDSVLSGMALTCHACGCRWGPDPYQLHYHRSDSHYAISSYARTMPQSCNLPANRHLNKYSIPTAPPCPCPSPMEVSRMARVNERRNHQTIQGVMMPKVTKKRTLCAMRRVRGAPKAGAKTSPRG